MALTIHYELKKQNCRTRDAAFDTVAALRERALNLPFDHVGEIVELSGDQCDHKNHRSGDDRFALALRGRAPDPKCDSLPVGACHIIGFLAMPGPGSEAAGFGLARYPRTITIERGTYQGQIWRTSLKGWSWTDFCKTGHALEPGYGGLGNFLRCHLTVIKMLDATNDLGVLRGVWDDSGYWDDRNFDELINWMGGWGRSNESIRNLFHNERSVSSSRDSRGELP